MTNYRPISILSCFSKVLEKLIYIRMASFLNKHGIINTNQNGFQKKLSTIQAVLDVITSRTDQTHNGNYTGIVLLDFKKAFDIVCHSILVHKLNHQDSQSIINIISHWQKTISLITNLKLNYNK